jgi:hypothetical protein
MSGRSNLDELLDVLEGIRKEKYPHIPAEVIREIVVAQYDNQDKRLEARNATNKIVSDFLNEVAAQEG